MIDGLPPTFSGPDAAAHRAVVRYERMSFDDFSMEAPVKVLPDNTIPPLSPDVGRGAAAWAPWAYRRFDAAAIGQRALRMFAALARQEVEPPPECVGALKLSFWLASQLPVGVHTRQQLLDAATGAHSRKRAGSFFRFQFFPASLVEDELLTDGCRMCLPAATERLLQCIEALAALAAGGLYCGDCRQQVATAQDLTFAPGQHLGRAGRGMHFVNSHGVVHDIITLSGVSATAACACCAEGMQDVRRCAGALSVELWAVCPRAAASRHGVA